MKKTLIILPFYFSNDVLTIQAISKEVLNLIGRINVEQSYFENNRTLNVIPYNGILTKEQKHLIAKYIKRYITDNVISNIYYIEGEGEQFSQTMQLK